MLITWVYWRRAGLWVIRDQGFPDYRTLTFCFTFLSAFPRLGLGLWRLYGGAI